MFPSIGWNVVFPCFYSASSVAFFIVFLPLIPLLFLQPFYNSRMCIQIRKHITIIIFCTHNFSDLFPLFHIKNLWRTNLSKCDNHKVGSKSYLSTHTHNNAKLHFTNCVIHQLQKFASRLVFFSQSSSLSSSLPKIDT